MDELAVVKSTRDSTTSAGNPQLPNVRHPVPHLPLLRSYGLQEENGGVLLSTSSFILEVGNGGPNASSAPPDPAVVPYLPRSGPYPNMYRDWAYFVGRLSNITDQVRKQYRADRLHHRTPLTYLKWLDGGHLDYRFS